MTAIVHEIKAKLITLIQGIVIGIGNIIPGVSGGTVALILGIYPRTVRAVAGVRWQTVKAGILLATGKKEHRRAFVEEMARIDAVFLILLGIGEVIAIGVFSFVLSRDSYLMQHHPAATYSFFLGLVLLSILFPYGLLRRKSWKELVLGLAGVALVVLFAMLKKDSAGHDTTDVFDTSPIGLSLYFAVAVVAICAMVLPGISGSLTLVIFGYYFEILSAVKIVLLEAKNLVTTGGFGADATSLPAALIVVMVFSAGCVVGLIYFSRLIDSVLRRYYNPTMAFLTGLVVGSLYGIGREGNIAAQAHALTAESAICLASFVAGCVLVGFFYRYEKRQGHAESF